MGLIKDYSNEDIIKKKKRIRKELISSKSVFLEKKIAILGGSTTNDVKAILDLFLLDYGIKAEFYESEYNQYYQEAMFASRELKAFNPDIIYIHTSNRNIKAYPEVKDTISQINEKLEAIYQEFVGMWNHLYETYHCPIIQNNMELPSYRLLGNREASDFHGRVNFIQRLNEKFNEYAREHENFYINDINYISACYGLEKWSEPFYWYMYKYALAVPAIPELTFNIAKIIKAIYGLNKKAFVCDLDNTLWGGVISEDGVDKLEIGQETPIGQAYAEFQAYIKQHIDIGVIVNIASKNDLPSAIEGLNHPEGVLKYEDFIVIRANWEPKSENIIDIARELNILESSIVFVDDNPAEREIVKQYLPDVAVPDILTVENYIHQIDRNGYFETVTLSNDDIERNTMYKANIKRSIQEKKFRNYEDYLLSLEMEAVIRPFDLMYVPRIVQLINKINQFNFTTKRYNEAEIKQIIDNDSYVTLYGKLNDKFGSNGIVTVIIGRLENEVCHIELWLMSCRVLKRNMEFAMMDSLVRVCKKKGIRQITGYYIPTAKNVMVKEEYSILGFRKILDDKNNTVWRYDLKSDYHNKNTVITVKEGEEQ